MSSDDQITRTMKDKFAGFERCQKLAETGTYFGCDIGSMQREELLAVIGHMVELQERSRKQRTDYIHSSAVASPIGGISPRSRLLPCSGHCSVSREWS